LRKRHAKVNTAEGRLDRVRQERRRQWETKYPRKKYIEAEPVDESDLPELPEGWCWVSAEEVVEQGADIRYGIVQHGPALKQGVLYVQGIDIQDGRILVEQLWKTSQQIAEHYRGSMLREGDVLLGIIRHLKVAIVPKPLDGGNMARTTARLRPSSLVSS